MQNFLAENAKLFLADFDEINVELLRIIHFLFPSKVSIRLDNNVHHVMLINLQER